MLNKNNCIKHNIKLITRKYKIRDHKIIGSITVIYSNSFYIIKIYENYNTFIDV